VSRFTDTLGEELACSLLINVGERKNGRGEGDTCLEKRLRQKREEEKSPVSRNREPRTKEEYRSTRVSENLSYIVMSSY